MIDFFCPNFGCRVENSSEIRKDEEVFNQNSLHSFSSTSNLGFEDHDIVIPSQTSSTNIQNTPTIEPDSQSNQALPTPNENDGFEVLPAIIAEIINSHIQSQNQAPFNFPAKRAKRTDKDRYKAIPGYLSNSSDSKYEEVKLDIYHKFNKILKRDQLHRLFEQFCIYLHMHELFKQYSRAANKRQGVMLEFFSSNFQEFRIFLAQTSIEI